MHITFLFLFLKKIRNHKKWIGQHFAYYRNPRVWKVLLNYEIIKNTHTERIIVYSNTTICMRDTNAKLGIVAVFLLQCSQFSSFETPGRGPNISHVILLQTGNFMTKPTNRNTRKLNPPSKLKPLWLSHTNVGVLTFDFTCLSARR